MGNSATCISERKLDFWGFFPEVTLMYKFTGLKSQFVLNKEIFLEKQVFP